MSDDDPAVDDLHVATVVINVQDMAPAVGFWSAALGYRQRESEWDDEFMSLVPATAGGCRSHCSWPRARHVERLVGLGASRVENWPSPDDADFIVLRDPDGNEFYVIDHAPLGS